MCILQSTLLKRSEVIKNFTTNSFWRFPFDSGALIILFLPHAYVKPERWLLSQPNYVTSSLIYNIKIISNESRRRTNTPRTILWLFISNFYQKVTVYNFLCFYENRENIEIRGLVVFKVAQKLRALTFINGKNISFCVSVGV